MDKDRLLVFLIISEVVITTIAFVGAYYIFKPVFKKQAEKLEQERLQKKSEQESQEDKPDY